MTPYSLIEECPILMLVFLFYLLLHPEEKSSRYLQNVFKLPLEIRCDSE
jgi:hypothetical protein